MTGRIRDAWERRPETWLSTVILGVIVINWFWWGAERAAAGGSALGGYASDGRYFLSGDGIFVEVTQAAWIWSLVHAAITLVSFVTFLGIILFYRVPRGPSDYRWLLDAGPASPSEADMEDSPQPEATPKPDPALPSAPLNTGAHAERRLLDHPPGR